MQKKNPTARCLVGITTQAFDVVGVFVTRYRSNESGVGSESSWFSGQWNDESTFIWNPLNN